MELALDPGEQDLLGFLLEESGDLGAAPGEILEAPLDWELPLSEVCVCVVGGRSEAGRRGPGCSWGLGGDRPRTVHLNPVQALSDWDVEDFLRSLPSPPASLNIFSNSNPCLVHHDHTYSLSQEHVSIDLGEHEIVKFGGKERIHGPGCSLSLLQIVGAVEKRGSRWLPCTWRTRQSRYWTWFTGEGFPRCRGGGGPLTPL